LARRLKTQARLVGKASAAGRLYDLGRYPGAIFQADDRERIIGEVFALRNAARLLAELDAYEGVVDPGSPAFKRVEIKARLDKGGVIDAWAYALAEATARSRRIEGGDFILHARLREGRPNAFLAIPSLVYLCQADRAAKRAGSRSRRGTRDGKGR
jgi:gamma-glutamylcyclotransferase (GGCT)/AIG2-like uncharacterized protein YtfP